MITDFVWNLRRYINSYEFEPPERDVSGTLISDFEGFRLKGDFCFSPVPINGKQTEDFSKLERFAVSFKGYVAAKVKLDFGDDWEFMNIFKMEDVRYSFENFQVHLDKLKEDYGGIYNIEGFSLDSFSKPEGVSLTAYKDKINFRSFEKEREGVRELNQSVLIERYKI